MSNIIRGIMVDLNVAAIAANKLVIADMVAYFNRQEDHEQIRSGIKDKFGKGIKKTTEPGSETAIETYAKGIFDEEVDAGLHESISSGYGNKVVNAQATLFTERGQTFSLVHETDADTEKAEALLQKNRVDGGFKHTMVRTDRKSVQIGSAGILMSFHRQHMTYQTVTPDVVTAYFSDYIIEDEKTRSVDTTDIEDASLIVVRLSQVDVSTWNYLAIFGRSSIHPKGRRVEFQSTSEISRIPEPYKDGAREYEIEGEYCNPLSYVAFLNPELYLPEYPLAIIKGGTTDAETLFPTTTSLYDDAISFDIGSSHLLEKSQDAAGGLTAITRQQDGVTQPLPSSLRGQVALMPGQTIEHISLNAAECVESMTVLKDLQVQNASGYSCPDYMVTSEDHAIEASSGIALQVKTRPLKKAREDRVETNGPVVQRVFEIEKSYIWLHSQAPQPERDLLFECSQTWEAGELKLPENKKELSERIIALMGKGILDTIAGIREYYQLSTDAEAIEIYDTMKERKEKYKSLIDEPMPVKPPIGLKSRNARQPAAQPKDGTK